jgi:hypothetical protein
MVGFYIVLGIVIVQLFYVIKWLRRNYFNIALLNEKVNSVVSIVKEKKENKELQRILQGIEQHQEKIVAKIR